MPDTRQERMSFADTLRRIETLEQDIEAMLAPSQGWEWWRTPSADIGGIRGASHVLTLGRPPSREGGAWTPCLAVYVAQGGGNRDERVEQRAVAFDREGQRYVLDCNCEGHADHDNSDGWVEATLFKLPPETLPPADVAFVGIEAKVGGNTDE